MFQGVLGVGTDMPGFCSVLLRAPASVVYRKEKKKCDEFYLEVRCSNTEAARLYEKLGFVIKQQLNAYYRDGEDAYLMAIEFEK